MYIIRESHHYHFLFQHSGALLLSTAAFNDPVLPQNWCKYVVGSEQEILRLFISSFPEKCTSKTLKPNEPTQIVYNETEITITLIPAGKNENGLEARLFYIDSWYSLFVLYFCSPAISICRWPGKIFDCGPPVRLSGLFAQGPWIVSHWPRSRYRCPLHRRRSPERN